jgi:outer membrane protein assembly factor BamB
MTRKRRMKMRPERLVALFAAILFGACVGAAQNDLSRQAGMSVIEPQGTAVANVLWSVSIGEPEPFDINAREVGGVAVAQEAGIVIACGRTGQIQGRFTASGELAWTIDVEFGLQSTPAAGGQHDFYVGMSDGRIVSLDARSGAIRWEYQAASPFHGAVTVGERAIYAITADNALYAIDRVTGQLRWRHAQSRPTGIVLMGAPEVLETDDGSVVAGFSDGRMVRLSPEGEVLWIADLSSGQRQLVDVDVRPLSLAGVYVAASFTGGVSGVDPGTGRLLWTVNEQGATSALAVSENTLALTTSVGRMLWINAVTGELLQVFDLESDALTELIPHNGMLLAASKGKGVFVLGMESPWIFTRFDAGTGFSTPPTVGIQGVFALDNRGSLYRFELTRSTVSPVNLNP